MLDNPKHKIKGLHLPKGGCVRDQTFVDDTALYFKGSPSNLSKVRAVFELFYLASGAKVNWGKFAAIWANKEKKGMGVGTINQVEMDPRGTRGSIFRHPNRLPATHRGQF
jgi:hypothetical protein